MRKNEVVAGSASQKFLSVISKLFAPIANSCGYKPWYQKYSGGMEE